MQFTCAVQVMTKKWCACPFLGIRFFDHNSAIFWPIGLEIFEGNQETIIYRLVVRNRRGNHARPL